MQGGGDHTGAAPLGPRVDPTSVKISGDGRQITLNVDKPLLPSSVKPDAFMVTVFSAATDSESRRTTFPLRAELDPNRTTVTLTVLPTGLVTGLARIIARGTGAFSLLSADSFLPLAGATDSAPAPQGSDYVFVIERN